MSKWLNLFLENEIVNRSDKSDRFDLRVNLSGLSGGHQECLDEKKVENNLRKGSDKSDRFKLEPNMSPLSLRPRGLLDQNLRKLSEIQPDKPDRFNLKVNMSVMSGLSGPSLRENFDERLAIAEMDGNQNLIQAHRISYLDAFISILSTLAEDDPRQDWLTQKIQTTLAILEAQNFPALN